MTGPGGTPAAGRRKRRTREHVIADLSVNHVERHVLRCGFAVERVRNDYGIDLELFFFDAAGHWKNGRALIQLKATDHPLRPRDGSALAVRLDRRDVLFWREETGPVILVVYDAPADRAYWLHLQPYLEQRMATVPSTAASVTVHVPATNVVDPAAIRAFEKLSDAMVRQVRGMIRRHD